MRARFAIAMMVALVLTFLQNGGARSCDPGPKPPTACCCCMPELPSECTGMTCAAPAGTELPSPISLLMAAPGLAVPPPAVTDARPSELPDAIPASFARAPLALATHPPPLSLSCILLI